MAARHKAHAHGPGASEAGHMIRFLDAPAPRGRVANRAPRRAPLEPSALPNRLRHVRARDPCPRLHTPRNAPRLNDCRRPPGRPPQSQPTLIADTSRRDLFDPSNVRTSAQYTRRHWMRHMRSLLIERDANCRCRQHCARVRATNTESATQLLTATVIYKSTHLVRTPTKRSPARSTRRPHERALPLTPTSAKWPPIHIRIIFPATSVQVTTISPSLRADQWASK